jgi:hypothetical protein
MGLLKNASFSKCGEPPLALHSSLAFMPRRGTISNSFSAGNHFFIGAMGHCSLPPRLVVRKIKPLVLKNIFSGISSFLPLWGTKAGEKYHAF